MQQMRPPHSPEPNAPALQQVLRKAAQLADTDARTLRSLQLAAQPRLQLSHIQRFTVSHSLPEVLVGAENGILAVAYPPAGHGAAHRKGCVGMCVECVRPASSNRLHKVREAREWHPHK